MSEYKKTTVVFPIKSDQILLGMKKRGFGAGWWNGFGGKLEQGESYEASAMRETREEVEVEIDESGLVHAADIVFRFDGSVDVVTKAFIARAFSGNPVETEEMRPEWFALNAIPYDTMWPGDDKWIPQIIHEQASLPQGFIVDFTGDNEFTAIKSVDVSAVESYF